MTNCTEKALLGDYLDRELSPAEKKRVESHLGGCAGCRAELDELKSLSNFVGGLPQAPLPVGFMDRLERRRRSGPSAVRAARPWHVPVGARLAAFAAASLLVTIVVYDKVRTTLPSMMISGAASNLPSLPEDELRVGLPAAGKATRGLMDAGGSREALKKAANVAAAAAAPAPMSSFDQAAVPAKLQSFAKADARGLAAGRGSRSAAKKAKALGAPIEFAEVDAKAVKAETAAAQEVSNEALQKDLERQERSMGMRGVIAPRRYPMGQMASTGGVQKLDAAPAAAPIGAGSVAGLLAQPVGGFGELKGAGAGGSGAKGVEPPPPALFEGVVVHSEQERARLWTSHQMSAAAPRVDYARKMLVVVFGPMDSGVEIADIKVGLEKTVVQYRQFPLPEGATRKTQAPPYQFRAVTKNDRPVVFQRLP